MTKAQKPILEVKNIVAYGKFKVLHNVNISVPELNCSCSGRIWFWKIYYCKSYNWPLPQLSGSIEFDEQFYRGLKIELGRKSIQMIYQMADTAITLGKLFAKSLGDLWNST